MDSLTELKSSFKDLTKYLTFLLIPLITIGAYVIQRSYMAVMLSDSLESDFIDKTKSFGQQSQVSFSGLTFSYGAMNMFWPVIIFVLYVVILLIVRKQSAVIGEIRNIDNSHAKNLLFDPMNLFREIQIDKFGQIILATLLFIPLFGLLSHFLSGIFIFWKLNCDQVADMDSADALILQLYLQLALTFISLIFSIGFPFKLLRTFKKLLD